MRAYYHARAREYDDVWLGRGLFADRVRPGWDDDREALFEAIRALPPARTLDVACGTGFVTQHLPGDVVGLDQSDAMLELARARLPHARFVEGDALALPFADGSFDRVFASWFYCHLEERDRRTFLAEARRVASEFVVVASLRRDGVEPARWEERVLSDGSRWEVFKRYFRTEELIAELGDGAALFVGRHFVAVRALVG